MRLNDKVAIVVGAGQSPGEGLGNARATALRFGQEGARVMARQFASAEETAAAERTAAVASVVACGSRCGFRQRCAGNACNEARFWALGAVF